MSLEKETYSPGDIVKGKLSMFIDEPIKVKKFEFFVIGRECINIKRFNLKHKYYPFNHVFFHKDLSNYLISMKIRYIDDIMEVTRDNQEFPFSFVVPKNSIESYEGKRVLVKYIIAFKAILLKKRDISIKKTLNIIRDSTTNREISDEIIFSDNREKGEETTLKVELEKFGIVHNTGFVKGNIIVENPQTYKIRKILVSLKSVEDTRVGVLGGFSLLRFALDYGVVRPRYKKRLTVLQVFRRTIKYNDEKIMPFEFNIPNMKASYRGTFSAFYWLLDAKIDIPWTYDLHLKIHFGRLMRNPSLETLISSEKRLGKGRRIIMLIVSILMIIIFILRDCIYLENKHNSHYQIELILFLFTFHWKNHF